MTRGTVSHEAPVTAKAFEDWIQEATVMARIVKAISEALRRIRGRAWLIAFQSPSIEDISAIYSAVSTSVKSMVELRTDADRNAIHEHLNHWLKRFEEHDRLTTLRDLTERVGAKEAGSGGQDGGDIILEPEKRDKVADQLASELRDYLGHEQSVAMDEEVHELARWLVMEYLGAGALEQFIRDPNLTEIMVGDGGKIWVELDGRLIHKDVRISEERARWFAQRLAAKIGSRVDQAEPSMDGYLSDGSRVHVILKPIAMDGVSITIRRHTRRPSLFTLIHKYNALTQETADFLEDVVKGMCNTLVSGGTSSGKTTLLNVVASFIADHERVLTMEDAPELDLKVGAPNRHVVRLRTRKPNIEGRGEFTMRMLVRESLRMRPDRIVVGEVRGAEALDMIEAMNTGHDGCLTTAHANGPLDMLKRLGQMMKRGDPQLTDSGAYELVASALHLIVHAERRVSADGTVTRGVMEIAEVARYEPNRPGTLGFVLRPLFERGPDNVLRRIGGISDKLADHLRLGGRDPARWVMNDGH